MPSLPLLQSQTAGREHSTRPRASANRQRVLSLHCLSPSFSQFEPVSRERGQLPRVCLSMRSVLEASSHARSYRLMKEASLLPKKRCSRKNTKRLATSPPRCPYQRSTRHVPCTTPSYKRCAAGRSRKLRQAITLPAPLIDRPCWEISAGAPCEERG